MPFVLQKTYQKVYDWQFIFCLELWTKIICAYNSEADFGPLAYPLTQIISGVATLVPSARYFPLRLRCIKMLNRIAAATDTFSPVNTLLLDMLDMKELHTPPKGGVGKAVDLQSVKQLDKLTLKTRAFQEACIYATVEELAEHLAPWSCSVAFFELSFIPLVRLRSFCKSTKVDRFRREIRELIRQVLI
ncbi:nucleolar complex protein 2 homolog [Phalaenopsis equestris]|uniref:nucleolar complex protein 2 homolog n=1 Tax=Phalaenopsis equestris TaxID=78828 RepID=UPI0009E234C1|nr:nucleolar complex protein 2 homolog [Phalaenopsis equestris]